MSKLDSLARWPLLLGAILLFAVGLWEASHQTDPNRPIGIVAVCVACVLLGAWVYSLAIEAERRWHTATPASSEDAPSE